MKSNIIWTTRAIFLVCTLLCTTCSGEGSPWPNRDGNSQRTGVGRYIGPLHNPTFLWRKYTVPRPLGTPVISGKGEIVCYSRMSRGWVMNVGDHGSSHYKWVYDTKDIIVSAPAFDQAGENLYIPAMTKLHALDMEGKLLWTWNAPDSLSTSPVLSPSGTLYICTEEGNAFGILNGTVVWEKALNTTVHVSPSLDINGSYLYIGADNGNLYALCPDLGTELWRYSARAVISTPPVVKNGTVYMGSSDFMVHAVSAYNGSAIWQYKAAASVSKPTISPNGDIFFSAGNGYLYAVNYKGQDMWNKTISENSVFFVVMDNAGNMFVGGDYTLTALKPNGEILWSFRFDVVIAETPAIGFHGVIYITTGLGEINALSTSIACVHGKLDIPSVSCVCDAGYMGMYCDKCQYGIQHWCYHGHCDGHGRCVCDEGYFGENCNERSKEALPLWPQLGFNSAHTSWSSSYVGAQERVEILWDAPVGEIIGSSVVVGSDETVYFGGDKGTLFAVSDGLIKWAQNNGHSKLSAPAIGADGTIYCASVLGDVFAFKPDGELLWKKHVGSTGVAALTLRDEVLYMSTDDHLVMTLHTNGTMKWQIPTQGTSILSTPTVTTDGVVYITDYVDSSATLYAIDSHGAFMWNITFPNNQLSQCSVGADGTLYVGSYSREVHAFNSSGHVLWSQPSGSYMLPGIAVGKDAIYFSCGLHTFCALDAKNGTLLWSIPFYRLVASPAAIGADGTIYVATLYTALYAISPQGSVLWVVSAPTAMFSSAVVIGSDGAVYFGAGMTLYAVGGRCNVTCVHGRCSRMDGTCVCHDGYTGWDCATCATGAKETCTTGMCDDQGLCTQCELGYFGRGCNQECPPNHLNPCNNNGMCDPTSGKCVCDYGAFGEECQHVCPGGKADPCSGFGTCEEGICRCFGRVAYMNPQKGNTCTKCPDGTGVLDGEPQIGLEACVSCAAGTWGTNPNDCTKCHTQGCTGGVNCEIGYSGLECKDCIHGFYYSSAERRCKSCTNTNLWVLVVFLCIAVVVGLAVIKVNKSLVVQEMSIPLRIGLVYFQVISLLVLVDLRWPRGVHRAYHTLSFANIDLEFAFSKCWMSFTTKWLLTMSLPFILLVFFWILYESAKKIHGHFTGFFENRDKRSIFALLSRSYLSFLTYAYTFLCDKTVSVFDCTEEGGVQVLYENPSIECYSSTWYGLMSASLVGIICFVLGIPLLFAFMIRYSKMFPSENICGTLVSPYRQGMEYWEIYMCIWKLTIVLMMRFLSRHPPELIGFFIVVLLLQMIANVVFKPYRKVFNGKEEHLLIICSMGLLVCGAIFFYGGIDSKSQEYIVLYALAMAFILAEVFVIGWAVYTVFVWVRAAEEGIHKGMADGVSLGIYEKTKPLLQQEYDAINMINMET